MTVVYTFLLMESDKLLLIVALILPKVHHKINNWGHNFSLVYTQSRYRFSIFFTYFFFAATILCAVLWHVSHSLCTPPMRDLAWYPTYCPPTPFIVCLACPASPACPLSAPISLLSLMHLVALFFHRPKPSILVFALFCYVPYYWQKNISSPHCFVLFPSLPD